MRRAVWKALFAMAAGVCCAGLAAVLLIRLEPMSEPPDGRHLAVFRQDRSVRLDSNNLVDLLAGADFELKIRRVRWTGSVLAVDFAARDGEAATADAVGSDLKELIARAFGLTANVQRLLVRFEAEGGGNNDGRRGLLLAADVRRSDPWMAEHWDGLKDADPLRDRIWRERLRLTTTKLWEERTRGAGPGS